MNKMGNNSITGNKPNIQYNFTRFITLVDSLVFYDES